MCGSCITMYRVSPALQAAAGIVVPHGMTAFTSLTNLGDIVHALSVQKFCELAAIPDLADDNVWEAKRDLFEHRRELFGMFLGTDDSDDTKTSVTLQEGVVRCSVAGVSVYAVDDLSKLKLRKPMVRIHSATYTTLQPHVPEEQL